ncbi:MAG: SGNH/GDSL hydrolase family protein [Verrucomicrobiota bacterium]
MKPFAPLINILTTCLLFFGTQSLSPAAEQPFPKVPIKNGDQILFLGDSITQAGLYAALIQTWLWFEYSELKLDIIDLGLNGETASGNSEIDHPYPRANVHERIDRILKNTDPDLVFICYGMNDGIYQPFAEKRFIDYQHGIQNLLKKLRKPGRKIVLMTPPPFDLFTFRQGHDVAPKNAPVDFLYSYKAPYQDYDQVLIKYGQWILSQTNQVDAVVDLHPALIQLINKRRASNPDYKFNDGIHPPVEGHLEMALTILDSLGADRKLAETTLNQLTGIHRFAATEDQQQNPTDLWSTVQKRHRLLTVAWIEHIGHMKPGKAKTPSLRDAQKQAADMEVEIRQSLADIRGE